MTLSLRGLLPALLAVLALSASVADAQPGRPGGRPGAAGQGPVRAIQGTVVDAATGRGVGSAAVAVRSAADSSLVAGAVTRGDGSFRVEGLRPGRYYLRVSALGYATALSPALAVAPAAQEVDAGTVRLAAAALQLEGLQATAERPAASLSADRNTFRVDELPVEGGTATDVLRNIPAVEVDGEGRVSLRGNADVAVQINGRAAPMRGDQLTAFLQQLPAGALERVEVVPNPSARYDPEGMAGIVNLVLRQNADLGLSGGVTVGTGTGGRHNASANLGYGRGPLTAFLTYGLRADDRESDGWSLLENLSSGAEQRQAVSGDRESLGHTLNGSADLRLSQRTTLTSSLLASVRSGENGTLNAFRDLDPGGTLVERYDRLSVSEEDGVNLSGALGFKHVAQPRRNELAVEARLSADRDEEADLYTRRQLTLDGADAGEPSVRTRLGGDEREREWTLTADWTRALGAATRLETGYKGTLRHLENEQTGDTWSWNQDAWVPDEVGGRSFDFDEDVHALYGVVTRQAGPWELQAGLRAERAATEFTLSGDEDGFRNRYTSFYPSALAAYDLSDTRQLKASYSKRVSRPRTWFLNPFARFSDPQNVMQGNPYLRPEYTHALEVGFQQSGQAGTLQVTPYWRRTTDAIRRIRVIEGDTLTRTTWENVATSTSYGADLTGSLRGERLSGFGGLNVYRLESDAENVGEGLSASAVTWSTRLNGTWKVTPRLDVQAFVMYRAPADVEGGRIAAMSMTTLSLRQKVLGDAGTVTLRVMDPFDTMGHRSRTENELYLQETERRWGARGVQLTFSYNFGQAPRLRPERGQREEGGEGEEPEF